MAKPYLSLMRTLCLGVLIVPLAASAFTASTTRSLNVRGGPGMHFEVQTVLPPRTSVRVRHCNSGWRWCQVDSRRARGWVDSRFLEPSVRGRVPVVHNPSPRDKWSRPVG